MNRLVLNGLGYALYLIGTTGILLEILLRFYNPLNPRLKGDRIILPTRQRYEVRIDGLPGVQARAIHTKNSLGFRGAEPPADWSRHLTVITAGGSTTECYFLPDGTDWPAVLERNLRPALPHLWVNNAGLNGHSTFGHQILLDDHVAKLRPDVVLFLVGINELGRDQLGGFDSAFLRNKVVRQGDVWWKDWGRTLINNSEVASLIQVISRGIGTQKLHFRDNVYVRFTPADTVTIAQEVIVRDLRQFHPQLTAYEQRLTELTQTCRRAGIEPILITQPLLLGEGTDPLTGTDLRKFRLLNHGNGEWYWRKLDAYNDVTRCIAAKMNVHLIDLARQMPRSTAYFYDEMHYTEAGAAQVADLVARDLCGYLRHRYPVTR
jgi:lysophospholipase L1-like esterase